VEAPRVNLQPGLTLAGRYALGERIASGGMGEVFHARHLELDRAVALKRMRADLSGDPDFAGRFKREAMAAGRIGHPAIVDIFDLGRTADGRLFYVMEYVGGEPLATVLRREGALPAARTANLLAQVARALAAAHAVGIVHRDLKPDNVMVLRRPGHDEGVKVLDFGVAKIPQQGTGAQTAVGAVVGTPQYMAPEQAQGLTADARSDIYALGLLAHELLRGRPTFEAPTPSMLLVKQVTEAPPPFDAALASQLPPALHALVFRMLAKAPGDRPQSMSEVLASLEQASSPPRTRTSGQPARAALAFAAVASLLLVGGRSPFVPPAPGRRRSPLRPTRRPTRRPTASACQGPRPCLP